MVKLLVGCCVVGLFGCSLQAERARDATLPYHPTLDTLRAAPATPVAADAKPTRSTTARIEFEGFARAYPFPIGLTYSHDGVTREVVGIETSQSAIEDDLGALLLSRVTAGEGEPVQLGGGVVQLAQ